MDKDQNHSSIQRTASRQKLLEGIHLQEIEGNPLTSEEIDMFEMFEREGWSGQQCREYILNRFREKRLDKTTVSLAAE